MKRKGLVFILDGLGDRPCPQLGGQTPLEAATTPALDRLAADNQCGMMDPLMPGMPVDTHTGVGILFGLPPAEAVRLRRGPIEAAGLGLELRRGDVVLRGNLACVEKVGGGGYRIIDRRAGRIRDEGQVGQLCAALQDLEVGGIGRTGSVFPKLRAALQDLEVGEGITASLHPATQHRTVLQLRGEGLSAQVSDTDPGGHAIERGILKAAPSQGFESDADARATADALNRFTQRAHDLLTDHPVNAARAKAGLPAANGVILRSAGAYQPLSNLLSRLGLKVAAVAGEMTVLGLAKLLDFDCHNSPRFTSLPDTDLAEKLRVAVAALASHDLVFVHIKGTDTAAHDKDPALKSEFISRFDRELGNIDLGDTIVGFCADHSTDSVRGEHNGDPVPILIRNPEGRRDGVHHYNETACISGALGRITAQGFLTTLLDAMGALGNYKPSDADFPTSHKPPPQPETPPS